MSRGLLATAMLLVALPVSAQQVALEIHDGMVTLTANGATVRQVLTEWGRVGGTRVVGAERLSNAPLTLRLENVPEAKALDIILRGAAGFLAATRVMPGSGASTYDRILVLATSTAPTGGTAAPSAPRVGSRFTQPGQDVERDRDLSDTGVNEVNEAPVVEPNANPFAGAFAQPGAVPFGQPAATIPFGQPGQAMPFGQPGQAMPFGQPVGGANGLFQPVQPDQQPPPQGLFGGVGSATPGVISTPAPQGQQQPGTRPRPPG